MGFSREKLMEMAMKARELAKPDATKDGGGRMHGNDKSMKLRWKWIIDSFVFAFTDRHPVCGLQI